MKQNIGKTLKNTGTTLLDLYLLYDMLGLDLQKFQTTLLDLNWSYMLELTLKNIRTILLDLDWFYLFKMYWTWTWETFTTRTTSLYLDWFY